MSTCEDGAMEDLHESIDLPFRSRGWTAYKNERLQTG